MAKRSVRDQVDIRIIDAQTVGRGRPSDRWIIEQAGTVLTGAVDAALRDDRFDHWTPPSDLVAAIALAGPDPIGYLGGAVDRGRLQLDALVVSARAERGEGHLLLAALHRSLERSIAASGARTVELWGKPERSWHRSVAESHGFTELRALHQLRCTLPLDAQTLTTRAFVVGQDEERLLRVNNRSFAHHPDQGDMTLDDLAEAAAGPWFDPNGIRLFDDPDDPNSLAGFCWTKIHDAVSDGQPKLGEIYAIGVDPDHQGEGLGKPLTAAGLAWLAGRGLTTGMLYVEADNEPALRTYYSLGFVLHRTDRAWHRPVGS